MNQKKFPRKSPWPAGVPPKETRKELKYYGSAACLALWQRRPHDVIRIYLEEARLPQFAAMLKWAAAQRKAYHIVGAMIWKN